MRQLTPYLFFTDDAREAMTFYQSVFGGVLTISTYGDFGMEGPGVDRVMHAQLATDDLVLMASDRPEETGATGPREDVVLCLNGDDPDVLRSWFSALAEGGEVSVPLEKQVWGDEFGDVTDRFGMHWMANVATP